MVGVEDLVQVAAELLAGRAAEALAGARRPPAYVRHGHVPRGPGSAGCGRPPTRGSAFRSGPSRRRPGRRPGRRGAARGSRRSCAAPNREVSVSIGHRPRLGWPGPAGRIKMAVAERAAEYGAFRAGREVHAGRRLRPGPPDRHRLGGGRHRPTRPGRPLRGHRRAGHHRPGLRARPARSPRRPARLGRGNQVGTGTVIGSDPQHLAYARPADAGPKSATSTRSAST